MKLKSKATAALFAMTSLALCSLPQGARAQTVNFTFTSAGTSDIVDMDGIGNVYAGLYMGELGTTSINIFCTDFTHDITVGPPDNKYTGDTTYYATDAAASDNPLTYGLNSNGFYDGGLASAMTATDYETANLASGVATKRADAVAYLADKYINNSSLASSYFTGSTTATQQYAAVSMAIWDIVQDGGDGLNTGQVKLDNTSQLLFYGNAVNQIETDAFTQISSSYTNSDIDWLQSQRSTSLVNGKYAHLQDYVYYNPNANHHIIPSAPEPSFPMLLLSFGVIGGGFWLRRRQESNA